MWHCECNAMKLFDSRNRQNLWQRECNAMEIPILLIQEINKKWRYPCALCGSVNEML
jgi:hypothetical protein